MGEPRALTERGFLVRGICARLGAGGYQGPSALEGHLIMLWTTLRNAATLGTLLRDDNPAHNPVVSTPVRTPPPAATVVSCFSLSGFRPRSAALLLPS